MYAGNASQHKPRSKTPNHERFCLVTGWAPGNKRADFYLTHTHKFPSTLIHGLILSISAIERFLATPNMKRQISIHTTAIPSLHQALPNIHQQHLNLFLTPSQTPTKRSIRHSLQSSLDAHSSIQPHGFQRLVFRPGPDGDLEGFVPDVDEAVFGEGCGFGEGGVEVGA